MKKFIKFSQEIGQNIAYIQGRGGNTSYKKNNCMYVKASGWCLKDVREEYGLICCNRIQLLNFFQQENKLQKNDLELNKIADVSMIGATHGFKPSIEIGMHAVIPSKYIVHTHSTYVNVFACMGAPEKYLDTLLTKYPYTIIPYKHPGFELAAYLFAMQKKQTLSPILILRNHGLVIHANSLTEVKKIHDYVNTQLKKITGEYVYIKKISNLPLIIPDAVVYNHVSTADTFTETNQEFIEIASALLFVTRTIAHLGEEIVYLTDDHMQSILNMEREKLRIQVIQHK